jgi:hypothetical protein
MSTTQATWPPAQAKAWNDWMEAEYSALYWRYVAARLGKIVVGLNVFSALTGASAVTLLITDFPVLTKIVALTASALTLFVSYCGYQSGYEKAKIRSEFYSKLSLRYERLWHQVNQQLEEAAIYAELDVLLEQESLAPADPDEEFDDRLRERAYRILMESKGLPA